MKRLAIILFVGVALAGCTSPEATRQRGGGSGADVGNRPAQVMMHEGSRQYYETPVRIGTESPPLGPSEQARTMSLPGSKNSDPSAGGGQQ